VQPALGVAAGVLGVLLAVTRHGLLILFTAAMPAPDRSILAVLCIVSLSRPAPGDGPPPDAAAGGRDRDPVNRRAGPIR
jgi:hypothetical protein